MVCVAGERSAINFEITLPTSLSANDRIVVKYGPSFVIPTQTRVTDRTVNRLICKLNNIRVRCVPDGTNLTFYVNLAISSYVHVYATSVDDNDVT